LVVEYYVSECGGLLQPGVLIKHRRIIHAIGSSKRRVVEYVVGFDTKFFGSNCERYGTVLRSISANFAPAAIR
jgi:hypothetical protein